jgi:hypothetical protein
MLSFVMCRHAESQRPGDRCTDDPIDRRKRAGNFHVPDDTGIIREK